MNRRYLLCFTFFLFPCFCFGQKKITGNSFTWRFNGFCSTYYKFLSDSIYLVNSGCESTGYTSYGTYEVRGDTLICKDGIIVEEIKITKTDTIISENGNELILRFFDQKNESISSKFKAYFKRNDNFYSLKYDKGRDAIVLKKITTDTIQIRTLEDFGIFLSPIIMNFDETREYVFHINIPPIVSELQLYNKDIKGNNTIYYLFTAAGFEPLFKEKIPFRNGPEIYIKD